MDISEATEHTESSFIDLLSCQSEYRQQFGRNLNDGFGHHWVRVCHSTNHETSKEAFDTFKEPHESNIAPIVALGRLTHSNISTWTRSRIAAEDALQEGGRFQKGLIVQATKPGIGFNLHLLGIKMSLDLQE